jgi:biopolymer transport protein TolR
MPRRRNSDRALPLSADINITSLVDVAFTLLVIFIITAPILQGGVEVQIPRAQAEPLTSPEGVIVSVDRQGGIFIGEAAATETEFEAALRDVVRRENASTLYLRADAGVDYGTVLRVLGTMKAMDVATVGLVAEPEGPAPRRRRG